MKKLVIAIAICCIAQTVVKSQTQQDSIAIRETVLNYIEGWYSGDAVRMEKSLHPDLAKRGVLPSRDGKTTEIAKATFSEMIEWTKQSPNLMKENKITKNDNKITIVEIGVNIASVKCVSKQFIDYLHLARINNEWKILNAIWEFNNMEMQKSRK